MPVLGRVVWDEDKAAEVRRGSVLGANVRGESTGRLLEAVGLQLPTLWPQQALVIKVTRVPHPR